MAINVKTIFLTHENSTSIIALWEEFLYDLIKCFKLFPGDLQPWKFVSSKLQIFSVLMKTWDSKNISIIGYQAELNPFHTLDVMHFQNWELFLADQV